MKGTCALLASVMAASTLALSSSFSPQHQFSCIGAPATTIPFSSPHQRAAPSAVKDRRKIWPAQHASGEDKFAPKFDGLRFIETLVTAHRLIESFLSRETILRVGFNCFGIAGYLLCLAKQVQLQAASEILGD